MDVHSLQASRHQVERDRLEKQVLVMDAERKQLQQQLTMLQQALNGWEKLHAGTSCQNDCRGILSSALVWKTRIDSEQPCAANLSYKRSRKSFQICSSVLNISKAGLHCCSGWVAPISSSEKLLSKARVLLATYKQSSHQISLRIDWSCFRR